MERAAYYFAWLNLVVVTVLWPWAFIANTTEPPIVLHLSFYAIWQGSLVFIITAHVDRKSNGD